MTPETIVTYRVEHWQENDRGWRPVPIDALHDTKESAYARAIKHSGIIRVVQLTLQKLVLCEATSGKQLKQYLEEKKGE